MIFFFAGALTAASGAASFEALSSGASEASAGVASGASGASAGAASGDSAGASADSVAFASSVCTASSAIASTGVLSAAVTFSSSSAGLIASGTSCVSSSASSSASSAPREIMEKLFSCARRSSILEHSGTNNGIEDPFILRFRSELRVLRSRSFLSHRSNLTWLLEGSAVRAASLLLTGLTLLFSRSTSLISDSS